LSAAPIHRILRLHSYGEPDPQVFRFVSGASPECLVITAARGVGADLLHRHLSAAVAGVHRFTLTQLAAVLAAPRLAADGKKPANRLAAEALTARVVHNIRTGPGFRYFAPVAVSPGFSRALAATTAELRMNRIAPEDLAAAGLPGYDLAACLRAYAEQLLDRGLADTADIYRYACEEARLRTHRFSGLPLLLYDVPLDSVSAREFAGNLIASSTAASSNNVLACSLAGDTEATAALEAMLGVSASPPREPDAATISRVRAYVFSPQLPAADSLDDTVSYFSAPGEAMECVEIARRIHQFAASGTAFDRLAILLRHPSRYQPLVEEALRRASVPAYFSRGVVRPDPAGRAFLALLACAMEQCSASRFAEYLSLGQVPGPIIREATPPPAGDELLEAFLSHEPANGTATIRERSDESTDDDRIIAGTLQAPAGWENLLIDASVIGGTDRWERRLRGLENELHLRLSEAGDTEHERPIRIQIERLRNLSAFALPLIRKLDAIPKSALWGEYLDSLSDLARSSLREPETVLGVLQELATLSDIGPVRFDEVFHVLSERLGLLRREPPDRRYGRVFIGSIEEVRGRWFDAVFLPGLAEGLFPAKVAEGPLLLDTHRARISPELRTNRQRREQERLLLRIALAAGSKIVFSYPRIDLAQSRPRVPSFYALEIVRSAYGFLPELDEFQAKAAAATPMRLDHPAPQTFEAAIDDTEYDLVALERVKGESRDQSGALNYLVSVNTALGRSLRARYQRWELRKWTPADGLFESTLLREYGLTERAYSPTTLQQFASCPYRFALHGIFGLRPREVAAPLYQMDALTRGALFHDVQCTLFRELERQDLLPVEASKLETVRSITDSVLDDVAATYADRLAPAIARVWRSEIEEIRTDLHGWLPHLAGAGDWVPAHFELAFGLSDIAGRDPSSRPESVTILGGIKVRGSIDLVERSRARGILRIVDHKTGKAPERKQPVVGGGATLQPLLYALAAREVLGAETESGALFYCTQRGNYEKLPVQVNDSTVKWLRRVTEIIDSAIVRGALPAAPARDACSLCDFQAVCGPYEQQRLRKKPLGELEELNELRCMP
jgi:ATP-dependent helicase/nuclease subunit B